MGRLVLASFSLLGSDHSQAADFRTANPLTLGGPQGGDGTASAQLQLSPGPPATMTLLATLSGSSSGLSINPSQVPITATPVTSR